MSYTILKIIKFSTHLCVTNSRTQKSNGVFLNFGPLHLVLFSKKYVSFFCFYFHPYPKSIGSMTDPSTRTIYPVYKAAVQILSLILSNWRILSESTYIHPLSASCTFVQQCYPPCRGYVSVGLFWGGSNRSRIWIQV